MSGGQQQKMMMRKEDGRNKVAAPRVVIINTQYVETDAVSFKSVVQKLTGKDDLDSSSASHHHRRDRNRNPDHQEAKRSTHQRVESVAGNRGVLARDISFKDFDKLLRNMPTMDDLLLEY